MAGANQGDGSFFDFNFAFDFDVDKEFMPDMIDKQRLSKCRDPEKMVFFTPDQVYQMIEGDIAKNKLTNKVMVHKYIRFGSYSYDKQSAKQPILATFTELGITCIIPHSTLGTQVKICVPLAEILEAVICIGPRSAMFCVSTGTKQATWVREQLGFVETDDSYYYCPLGIKRYHRWISFHTEQIPEGDVKFFKELFKTVLTFKEIPPNELIQFAQQNIILPGERSSKKSPNK